MRIEKNTFHCTPYNIFIQPYKIGYQNLSKTFACKVQNNGKTELSLKKRIIYLINGLAFLIPIINSILHIALHILFPEQRKKKQKQIQKNNLPHEIKIDKEALAKEEEIPPFYKMHFRNLDPAQIPSYEDLINEAEEKFLINRINPENINIRHQAILNRIAMKLQEAKYQEAVDAGTNPKLTINFEDIVCFTNQWPRNQEDELAKIIERTTNFLKELHGVKIFIKTLNNDEVILKANNEFANDDDREAIVKRIEKKLEDERYQDAIVAGRKPEITLNFEDTLTIPSEKEWDKTQKKIIVSATTFIMGIPEVKIIKQRLTFNEVIQKANRDFANDAYKDAIIERIGRRLQEEKYQEAIDDQRSPHILLNWEDTLWGEDYNETESKIIHASTEFIGKLPGIVCTALK